MKRNYIIILITIISIISLVIFGFYIGNLLANRTIIETTKDNIEEKEINTTYNIAKTNEISKYIPKNINRITITNILSDENNPTTINVEDIEKIEEFINLMFKTPWDEKNQISSNFDGAFYQITIIGDTKTVISMQGIRRIKYTIWNSKNRRQALLYK